MKRRAVFGQWSTPPQVLYPSSGIKKSTSMPVFSSVPQNGAGSTIDNYNAGGSNNTVQGVASNNNTQSSSNRSSPMTIDGGGLRRAVSYQNVPPVGRWQNPNAGVDDMQVDDSPSSVVGKRNAPTGVRRQYSAPGRPGSSFDEASDGGKLNGLGDISESEKRNKRLARNRASARMRRLRKKTIVETLEVECAELENCIAYLKQLIRDRKFSQGIVHLAQTESHAPDAIHSLMSNVVGGESDGHSISMARRRATIQLYVDRQIVACHQLQQDCVRNVSLVNWIASPMNTLEAVETRLAAKHVTRDAYRRVMRYELSGHLPVTEQEFAERPKKHINSPGNRNDTGMQGNPRVSLNLPNDAAYAQDLSPDEAKSEIDELKTELMQALNLDNQQKTQLSQLASGLQREQLRCDAMARASIALATHDWMEYPWMEQTISQFRGVLTMQQMNKFLGWSSRNADAIKALPLVPSPRNNQTVKREPAQI